jgi:DnaJ-class molecular chaperone
MENPPQLHSPEKFGSALPPATFRGDSLVSRPFRMDQYKTYDTSNGFGTPSEWRRAFRVRMGAEEAATIMRDAKLDPYVVLGITKSASNAEIKSAFRKASLACHPDRIIINNMTKETAEEAFKRLTAAYTILTDSR